MNLPHIYHPTHGPQRWPWWRLLVIHIVRCSHDPYWYFWMTPISYNIWLYTRWGALCYHHTKRRPVYRRENGRIIWTDQTW